MNKTSHTGFYYFLLGFSLIFKKGIRHFVFIPLLINTLLFSGLIYYAMLSYENIIAGLKAWLTLPDWLDWLTPIVGSIEWLILPLFLITLAVFVFSAFSIVATWISAPFNGILAEAVEIHLTGEVLPSTPFSLLGVIKGIFISIGTEIQKILYYLQWVILLIIISFIPIINIISPILWFIFWAWMLVVQYADYPMGNHGLKPKAQRKLLGKKRFRSLQFGTASLITTLVPALNFIVIPVAVTGATALWVGEFKHLRDSTTSN